MLHLTTYRRDQEDQARFQTRRCNVKHGTEVRLTMIGDDIKAEATVVDIQLLALKGVQIAIDALNRL